MSWLSSFWNNNRNFIGNAAKNLAPVASIFAGPAGLAGMALGGLGAAAGQSIMKGSNIGDILRTGVNNAAITAGGQSAYGSLKNAFNPAIAKDAVAATPGVATPVANSNLASAVPVSTVPGGGGSVLQATQPLDYASYKGIDSLTPLGGKGGAPVAVVPNVPKPPSSLYKKLDGLGGVLERNPAKMQAGQYALNAIFPSQKDKSEAEYNKQRAAQMEYQLQQEKESRAARSEVFKLLMQQLIGSRLPVAANPYTNG